MLAIMWRDVKKAIQIALRETVQHILAQREAQQAVKHHIFKIYNNTPNEYRWRLHSADGRIIAMSGESYKRRSDCENAIRLFRSAAPITHITKGPD